MRGNNQKHRNKAEYALLLLDDIVAKSSDLADVSIMLTTLVSGAYSFIQAVAVWFVASLSQLLTSSVFRR